MNTTLFRNSIRPIVYGCLLLLIALSSSSHTGQAQANAPLTITPQTPFGTPRDWFEWTIRFDADDLPDSDAASADDYTVLVTFPAGVLLLDINTSYGEARIVQQGNAVEWTLDTQGYRPPVLAIRTRLATSYDANVVRTQATLRRTDADDVLYSTDNHAIVVASLPATGETPVWRVPLFVLLAIGGLLLLLAGLAGNSSQSANRR